MANLLGKEKVKAQNKVHVAQVDFNSDLFHDILGELIAGKNLKKTKLPADVKTYFNTVRDHARLSATTYIWDNITHVKVTDWTGNVDEESDVVEGTVIYETMSSQCINKIQENPYILSYMIYGNDASARTGDGRWGSVNLCSATKAYNGLKVPLTKYSNQVIFLQFELEVV